MAHRWSTVHALPIHLSGPPLDHISGTEASSTSPEDLVDDGLDVLQIDFEQQQHAVMDSWPAQIPENFDFQDFVNNDAAMDFAAYLDSDLFTYHD
jgi:hypothetical protein